MDKLVTHSYLCVHLYLSGMVVKSTMNIILWAGKAAIVSRDMYLNQ